MVNFEQAVRLAWAYCEPRFSGPGTFTVAPWGYDDATHFLMVVGARESVIDGNADYLIVGDPAVLVDKVTGEVEEWAALSNLDQIDAMRPVCAHEAPAIR